MYPELISLDDFSYSDPCERLYNDVIAQNILVRVRIEVSQEYPLHYLIIITKTILLSWIITL